MKNGRKITCVGPARECSRRILGGMVERQRLDAIHVTTGPDGAFAYN